jgi:hypothetical protein
VASAKKCGDLVLDLIGDDAAGTLEGYTQTVTFTGNVVKAVAVFLAAGTSTSTVVRIRDNTAAADRLLITITWAAGVPTVTPTTGTHINTVTCADGTYRFLFQTTAVTAANAHIVAVYPATTAALAIANTGTVYAGGVQVENKSWPSAYIKTTTATVTTASDLALASMLWAPQDFSLYVRFQRPFWASAPGSGVTGLVGASNVSPLWNLSGTSGSPAQLTAILHDGTTQVGASANMPTTDLIDCCCQFNSVRTAGKVRIDVGGGFGSYSSATGPISAWQGTQMAIGAQDILGSTPADAGLRKVILATGALTLAQMRGINV